MRISMRAIVGLLVATMLFLGCDHGATSTTEAGTPGASPAARTLRVSMIPTTDPTKLLRDSEPLTSYLEKKTGAKVELTVPTNYAAVVEALVNDKVDIAYLGGFTFVQASERADAVPLVQRDKDQSFHSVFITQADSKVASLADLKGHSFAFGDVNSTSGHLMPEYFMREANVDPDVIAKAIYTGGHDATALAVANKKVDCGAMDETVFAKMTAGAQAGQDGKPGKLDPTKVKVFFTTPPFYDYVWAARKGLDSATADAFSRAFLELDGADPASKPLLDLLGATKYVKADDKSYDKLRQAARQAGLLK